MDTAAGLAAPPLTLGAFINDNPSVISIAGPLFPLSAAAVPVVGRIDGVLAGERSEAGKASSGEGGMARYA